MFKTQTFGISNDTHHAWKKFLLSLNQRKMKFRTRLARQPNLIPHCTYLMTANMAYTLQRRLVLELSLNSIQLMLRLIPNWCRIALIFFIYRSILNISNICIVVVLSHALHLSLLCIETRKSNQVQRHDSNLLNFVAAI